MALVLPTYFRYTHSAGLSYWQPGSTKILDSGRKTSESLPSLHAYLFSLLNNMFRYFKLSDIVVYISATTVMMNVLQN